jgi:uncharacterized membrane protein YhaH (DUF805 family)
MIGCRWRKLVLKSTKGLQVDRGPFLFGMRTRFRVGVEKATADPSTALRSAQDDKFMWGQGEQTTAKANADPSTVLRMTNPKSPISRNEYGIGQFVALILAGALLRPIDSVMLQNRPTSSIILVLVGAILVLSLMSLLAAKRLLDVGWSQYWTLMMSGPTLMYALLAVGRSNPGLLRAALIPVGLLFVLGGALIVALLVMPSKSKAS